MNSRKTSKCLVTMALIMGCHPAMAQKYPSPLPVESIGTIETLPATYPRDWVFIQDAYFDSMIDGRVVLVDTSSPSQPMKGMFNAGQMASYAVPTTGSDIYVAETYYSRLSRGTRTDVISIWDKVTLGWKGEIELPGGKRGQTVPTGHNFQLINDEKWAAVFNFTPAASISIVDLASRKILSDIDIPGCTMIYPLAGAGFMSLCADGTMASIRLKPNGEAETTVSSKPFNVIDDNPMFMTPARIGTTAWFATFKGDIRGIDLSGTVARDLGAFALPREKTAEGEWRPGGWQVIAGSDAGLLYVLMNSAGKEGSHKDGGSEIWVVDPKTKQRTSRFALKSPAFTIQVTHGATPRLVAALPDGSMDVYDATAGQFQHHLGPMVHSPYVMVAAP
ncbi:amine dehydrogenase large subunit [Sphingobium sp. CECT 9361]|uniref:amine dehydrogenase large subunit n=1 Tax=Sphingobium sp. CECT 9361 TaxID=2845384 RepID=UPI001E2B5E01|nr:amine dehydrogenase large subunit [Sphingobium sp. CECT 9361]